MTTQGRTLRQVFDAVKKGNPHIDPPPERLLCLDPGETTGWALFEGLELARCGQRNTGLIEHAPKDVERLLDETKPTHIVCEEYRVYSWKTDQHTWAALHTPKLIGAIHALAGQRNITPTMQMAQFAKQFCNDFKLKDFGFWEKSRGQKHARDAMRHGVYYLLFRKPQRVRTPQD